MDLSKLKNRAAYPFETIAAAISFSPQCKYVLAGAKQLADKLGASLILIHIGEKTSENENTLDSIMAEVSLTTKTTRVIWMEGDTVDTILQLCKLNIVDLLVLGAMQKENIFKFYVGSIARNISRKAKCSVLLLTKPTDQSMDFKKIVVNGVENPKTVHTVNATLYLAKHLDVNEVTIVNEVHVPGLAMAMAEDSTAPQAQAIKKNLTEESEETLHSVINKCDSSDVKITDKIIKGKPGYAISKYAKTKKADLLVVNSPDTNLNLFDRIFTHDMEFILAELPCNVLIIHSRINPAHGKAGS
ncbi:MAG TPA: universal stress protein [Bacteroidia bacterium]|jgi:nucleotide-binding universal stress UspA family protein|nr:universal stress protein [Bacteroidia bacterium]